MIGLSAGLEKVGEFLDDFWLDENSEIAATVLLVFEFVEDIDSEFLDVLDFDIADDEGIGDFLEAVVDGGLIDDGGFVEFVEGGGDFPTKFR